MIGTLQCAVCTDAAVPGDTRCDRHPGRYRPRRLYRLDKAARAYVGKAPMEEDPLVSESERRLGAPREIDPAVALLEELHRSAGHVAWLRERVEELEESELVWGKVMQTTEEREVTGHVEGDDGGKLGSYKLEREEHRAQINAWWDLYTRERKHLSAVSVSALKAGVEERRVRMYERSIDMLETIFTGAMGDLGIDANDPRVRRVLATRIRQAIEAGSAGVVDGGVAAEPTAGALARGAVVDGAGAPDRWT